MRKPQAQVAISGPSHSHFFACPAKHAASPREIFLGEESYAVFHCPKCKRPLAGLFVTALVCTCGWCWSACDEDAAKDLIAVYRCTACRRLTAIGQEGRKFLTPQQEGYFFSMIEKGDISGAGKLVLAVIQSHHVSLIRRISSVTIEKIKRR